MVAIRCWFILVLAAGFHLMPAAQPTGWCRSYSGTIGNYPIILHLTRMGQVYSGAYYYASTEIPLAVSGDDTTAGKDSIRLIAYLPDRESTEVFTLAPSGKMLVGYWMSASRKRLPVKAEERREAPELDLVFSQGSLLLRPKLKGSPEASFLAASVWPRGNQAGDEFLRGVIRSFFDTGSEKEEIGKILIRQKRDFFADYTADMAGYSDKDLAETYSLNYEENSRLEVFYRRKACLILSFTEYSFTGGAHGNFARSYSVLDLNRKRELEIGDILLPEGAAQLNRLLEKYFRKIYRLKPTDSLSDGGLFENHLEAGDNFYATAKGIVFSYAPYEIGPWAMGQIEIAIPFSELAGKLQPSFRKLIE